jgi:hypothetical protein
VSLSLALFTDLLVREAIKVNGLYHLQPGGLFWMFAVYYVLTSSAVGRASGWPAADASLPPRAGACLT